MATAAISPASLYSATSIVPSCVTFSVIAFTDRGEAMTSNTHSATANAIPVARKHATLEIFSFRVFGP